MGASIVYVLVLLGYNSLNGDVTKTDVMSWHLSHSNCNTVKTAEETRGRRPGYNQSYVCMRVNDAEMRARLEAGQNNYPRRHGSGNLTIRLW